MHADLDALVTALYVRIDDLLPARNGPGCPPKITDAELIALAVAVAQMFLGLPNDRKFYCASHSRYFWGFRLYLLCAPDGMPIAFELAAANVGEREVAVEMLARVDLDGYTVMADKGFAGEDFEAHMAGIGACFLRPDRKDDGLIAADPWGNPVFFTTEGAASDRENSLPRSG